MPRFSILTPVFDPPLWALERCIESVLNQTIADWEWCIVDDHSTNPAVVARLGALASSDQRVRLQRTESNSGIATASNVALAMARGEFVALLDHDDSLALDALEIVKASIELDPLTDYLYSDEDKVNPDGQHFDIFHKPDWAPERLLGQNYCCHLSVIRRSLLQDIGGFRSEFDGSQDYDVILRVSELTRRIRHIPRVLYHWQTSENSTAASQSAKPYAIENARRAVEEHLSRRKIDAIVHTTPHGYQKVVRRLVERPLVSVVIPSGAFSKNVRGQNTNLVVNCIRSILEKTTYENFELVVVLDANDYAATSDVRLTLANEKIQTVDFHGEFDFSAKCNLGAVSASGEIVVFLNDDTEILSSDWLETLVGHLTDPLVGIVGPRLLFEDGTIQSAGHTNDPSPHSFGVRMSIDFPGEFGNLAIAQERSGLTGACFALRRDLYFQVGGMSPKFPHCFNDVDLCFKVLSLGLRLIWTPFADLYHFESLSRDPKPRNEEIRALYERWGRFCGDDRYLPQPYKRDWRD
jgi:GT2 family glycosyltransferase